MQIPSAGGGWHALKYTFTMANRVGWWKLWRAMNSRNACKTCALGMGGQKGGMRNELGHWPEVCKKSLQAMVADMQGAINPQFFQRYSIKQLQAMTPRELEHCGRLTTPILARAGATHYAAISWDEAIEKIATKLGATDPQNSFFYFSGRSSNEAGFLLQLFARAYGTNHVNNCSYYCHQASGVGLTKSLGTGTATLKLEDVENADLFFLIGGNPASNHPRLLSTIKRLRRRGAKVVIINPLHEQGLTRFKVPSDPISLIFGTKIASHYLMPTIGSDMALLLGIAKGVVELGGENQAFIDSATEGAAAYLQQVATTEWREIESLTNLPRSSIIEISKLYAAAKNVVFSWTMGITHHLHGVDNVRAIANLALLRGMVGRKDAGLLPLRGHSNVQGMGTMGVTPAIKEAVLTRLKDYGFTPPTHSGYDTMSCMQAAADGKINAALCLGGNLYGSNPDAKAAAAAMAKIDLISYLSTTLNTGHAHGLGKETIILPVLARDEETQVSTQESMFSYIRLSSGGKARHQGPRSEVDIITDLAAKVGRGTEFFNWSALKNHDAIRALISQIVPGFLELKNISTTKKEFSIPGRILHSPQFATKSGKACFSAAALPKRPVLADNELVLMTIRSEGQFNTVVYEEEDLYRGQERRDIIMMNAEDCQRLGLQKDDLVTVSNQVGTMKNILVRPYCMAAGGAAMYFPEANILVPNEVDSQSKTPAFKAVVVKIAQALGV